VTILFIEGAAEAFDELAHPTKKQAARSIDKLSLFPHIYPQRRRGLMRGYRYFVAGRHLFYYSVSSTEVRITAIIPASMSRA
jgi:plasmid stabilization system protein ParE